MNPPLLSKKAPAQQARNLEISDRVLLRPAGDAFLGRGKVIKSDALVDWLKSFDGVRNLKSPQGQNTASTKNGPYWGRLNRLTTTYRVLGL